MQKELRLCHWGTISFNSSGLLKKIDLHVRTDLKMHYTSRLERLIALFLELLDQMISF
jgi:hypothetical protein